MHRLTDLLPDLARESPAPLALEDLHCAKTADRHVEHILAKLGAGRRAEVDAGYGSALSFRDPDGTALEFFAPPA